MTTSVDKGRFQVTVLPDVMVMSVGGGGGPNTLTVDMAVPRSLVAVHV